jgi:hypothetical protein
MNIPFSLSGGDQFTANVEQSRRVAASYKFGLGSISTLGCNPDCGCEVRRLMAIDLPQQVELLRAACRRLVLQPDEEPARKGMSRTIAVTPLLARPHETTFVRGLLDEARSTADELAFRLEGPGCDRIVVCALAAAFSRTLAKLRSQLRTTPAFSAGDFESHL